MSTLAEIIAARKASIQAPAFELLPTPALATQSPPKEKRSLAEILAQKHAIHDAVVEAIVQKNPTISLLPPPLSPEEVEAERSILSETFSLSIVLNSQQLLAKEMAFSGKSFCLIGAAGTGKTTAQREIAAELLRQNCLGTHNFRVQGTGEMITAPSIAFVAYTRIASGNLRRAIHKDPQLEEIFQHNITTIHNLLEYTPEYYWDYEEQKEFYAFNAKSWKGFSFPCMQGCKKLELLYKDDII